MNFSICTISLRHLKAEDAFRAAGQFGFQYLDVMCNDKDGHVRRALSPAERRQVVALAEQFGLKICSVAGGFGDGLNDPDPAVRQKTVAGAQAEIDLAAEVGASVVRGGAGKGKDLAPVLEYAVPVLKNLAAYAARKNLKIGIENHSNGVAHDPEKITTICRSVGLPNFGIIYEPGNLFGDLVDYKRAYEIQKDYIVHVHLKDGYPHYYGNDGFAPQRLCCTAFGKGQLNLPWILRSLKAGGYQGYVSVEYEFWHTEYPLPPVAEGLPAALQLLQQMAAGL